MAEEYSADDVLVLAEDINCGTSLALDLLRLAGGDASLVRKASDKCVGVESLKAYIIDHRFRKVEK